MDPNSPIDGRFVVTATDAESLMLRAVASAQILTLVDPPDLPRWTVLDATLVPADGLGVTVRIGTLREHFRVDIVSQDERPTARSRETAASLTAGASSFLPRADAGGTDVIALADTDHTEARAAMAADVASLVNRAARLDVRRVELRSAPGLLSVRYLP